MIVVSICSITTASADSADATYLGHKKCKMCHFKLYKSWAETKMAKAFELLKPGVRPEAKKKANLDPDKDYTSDTNCLKCHVTGYGEPGGFTSVEATPHLLGVQCESCHGPGIEYSKVMKNNKSYKIAEVTTTGLVSPVTADKCTRCHNTDSPFVGDDYKFDFEKRKEEGTHEHFPLKYEH